MGVGRGALVRPARVGARHPQRLRGAGVVRGGHRVGGHREGGEREEQGNEEDEKDIQTSLKSFETPQE